MYNIEIKLSFKEVSLFIAILNSADLVSAKSLLQRSGIDICDIIDILNSRTERGMVTCINNKYTIKNENVEEILYNDTPNSIACFENDEIIKTETMPLLDYLYFPAESLQSIFKKYLTELIPIKRQLVCFKDNRLSDFDELQAALRDMKADSLYFFYVRRKFYNELSKLCENFEDYCVNTANKNISAEKQSEVLEEISTYITKIYVLISKNYREFK